MLCAKSFVKWNLPNIGLRAKWGVRTLALLWGRADPLMGKVAIEVYYKSG